ncbi:MAG: ABC transporter ATP-binding protein [Deltaproteobacteria bacterium]|nr:ABC transporter ATP-binding protein [Deltaproteobacteria bacterium]
MMVGKRAAVLTVEGLAFGYPGRELGAGLGLELFAGEAVALLGPNGAGKTTLVRTLAGALPPLAGSVRLSGGDASALRADERARRVAVLPQGSAIDPGLTVEELVELGRVPHLGLFGRPGPEDRKAVAEALAACALEGLSGRPLGALSGGERQRAQIAMALAQRAPLLLLDEPLTHLDLRREHEFFELVGRLRRERGLALVLVLHDLRAAFREAGRVLLLDHGRGTWVPDEPGARRELLARAFEVPEERLPL